MKKTIFLALNILLFHATVFANKYWISAKNNTQVKSYLEKNQIKIYYFSSWLNSFSIELNPDQIELLKEEYPDFQIQKVQVFNTQHHTSDSLTTFDLSLESINGKALFEKKIFAKNIKIGILDAGYTRADSNKTLKHLFANNQIKATKDFVNPEKTDFWAKEYKGDSHGREVFKKIAGFDSVKNEFIGLATEAFYYLGRTENADKELKIEEDNWIAGLEWLDSLGVKIVNTSLGYINLFDNEADNYLPEQMDGKTAACTKAAQIAVNEKGMILITSAGNEGAGKWHIISSPADAPDVITVGATQKKVRAKISYSSVGPEFNDFIKPDIACFSPNGTSFAAPVITGLVACMKQIDSTLTAFEIKEILQKSSHLSHSPNNYIGFGVPNCENIIMMLRAQPIYSKHEKITTSRNRYTIVEDSVEHVVLFHKKNFRDVSYQSILGFTKLKRRHEASRIKTRKSKSYIKVVKRKNAKFTTVDTGKKTFEIEWK